jgi:hypothetical protein
MARGAGVRLVQHALLPAAVALDAQEPGGKAFSGSFSAFTELGNVPLS